LEKNGEIQRNNKKISKIKEIIDEVALEKGQFQIKLNCIGAFPRISSPRVIWIGITQGEGETKEIAKVLEEKIAKVGIPKEEREFSSHITIGRTRSSLNQNKLVEALKNIAGLKIEKAEFLVTKITLLKSTLAPKGPIYEKLKEASLKET
jgi:2'-5' RNA ligase